MKRIIINGANGYLASNFVCELLMQNYEVIALVRGENDHVSKDRMLEALSKILDINCLNVSNLKVFNYALLEDHFSLSSQCLNEIFGKEADYYHFAASLKFSKKTKDEIFCTNITGVENSVNVFKENAHKNARFFFVSTAYSCGVMAETFKERFYDNKDISGFRNYYENSKRYAENVIKDYVKRHNLNAHIIRPSQVVGSEETGVTMTDFGIFDFIKRVSALAFRYPGETIRVKVNPNSTQNLIPIDTIVYYLMQTVTTYELPTIINFVAKNSIKNSVIVNYINEILPVNILLQKELGEDSLTRLEKIINVGMSFTGGYVDTNIDFDTKNLDTIVKRKDVEITDESLQQMINYFVENTKKEKKV